MKTETVFVLEEILLATFFGGTAGPAVGYDDSSSINARLSVLSSHRFRSAYEPKTLAASALLVGRTGRRRELWRNTLDPSLHPQTVTMGGGSRGPGEMN